MITHKQTKYVQKGWEKGEKWKKKRVGNEWKAVPPKPSSSYYTVVMHEWAAWRWHGQIKWWRHFFIIQSSSSYHWKWVKIFPHYVRSSPWQIIYYYFSTWCSQSHVYPDFANFISSCVFFIWWLLKQTGFCVVECDDVTGKEGNSRTVTFSVWTKELFLSTKGKLLLVRCKEQAKFN